MIVSAIVAYADHRIIGVGNQLPWHLPADMKHFMRTTKGHHVIMGRKTYQSMGKPLPRRVNIVVTRDPYFIASGVFVAHSLEEALSIAEENGEREVFIIGGGEIYTQSLPYLEVKEGDTFFPEIDDDDWQLESSETYPPDEKNKHSFTIKIFIKKK